MKQFLQELERGVPPERIALVTFTRAARQEALDRALRRFAIAPKRFAWVRTIHSAAFRLLGLTHKQILDRDRLDEFACRHGYELTNDEHRIDDDPAESLLVRGRRRDDVLLFTYEWGRNCRLDLKRAIARCPVADFSVPQLRLFVRRLEEFKAEHELFDFTDLLEVVLDKGLRPAVDVAMVDEAHDLSPLQIAVVEMWFSQCERTYVCADDDQAIFNWQGASPDWIHGLAQRCETTVLQESHRVPILVHALAQRIITAVPGRMPKLYEPTSELGRVLVLDLDQALRLVEESDSSFILCRNRMFIARVAIELVERAVPFVVEGWGGRSPLSDDRAVNAVRLALALARGEQGPFPTTHVRALVSWLPASSNLIATGAREVIKSRKGQGSFMRDELVEQLGFGPLLGVMREQGPFAALPRLPRSDRRYFERLVERYGALPEPKVVLTSIHSAKGRERDLVLVLPDMTRSTYDGYLGRGQTGHDGESRVFYVAVTRAKQTLVLVLPRTRRYFQFPKFEVADVRL